MSGSLAGKVAIVTGASRDIGAEIALEVARRGARLVVATGRDAAAIEATAEAVRALGSEAVAVVADVTTRAGADRLVEAAVSAFGRVDILVNNAGAWKLGPLLDLDEAGWDDVFAVNCRGVFLASTSAARQMKRTGGGVIISIAGASAHRCYPNAGAFGPSKAAVVSLTQQMALEWADDGIRVNGVSPGPIRPEGSDWAATEPVLRAQVGRIPLKRVGTPREVAGAVAYLASDEAAYVTGHMLVVDGGGVATWYMHG